MKSNDIFSRFSAALLAIVWMVIAVNDVSGQDRDSTLNEVSVKGKHNVSGDARVNEFSPGQKVKTLDTFVLQQYQLQSMANLLSQQVPVFVKSYGFNGLATLNFRGSSAAQSTVLWNGVPIQNAALGIADVSLLPVMLMSKVNIVYGSSAAMWGSGNVGGAVLLENETPVFDSGKRSVSVCVGAGSFSQYMAGVKGSVSGKKLYFSVTAFGQSAQNDFRYTLPGGAQRDIQNGRLQSGSLMLYGAVKSAPDQLINIYLWLQQYDRLIPPAFFESASGKRQTDASVKFLTDWQKKVGKSSVYGKISLIQDRVNYKDDAIQIRSDNTVRQLYWETGLRSQFDKYGQMLLFLPMQVSWIRFETGSRDTKQQGRVALAGAYEVKGFKGRLNAAVNVRGEIIDSQSVFLPGANASFRVSDWFSLRVNVQRTYRVPTLNELYYFPGGNRSLKPEQGWNEDAGYTIKAKHGQFTFYHDLSVYNRDIRDWIYWMGGAIWTPHNIAKVNSRGVETENNVTCTVGNWKFHAGVNTSYVLATTTSSYIYNDGSVGKQIAYTPRYNGQMNIGFDYKQLSVNYNHTYTGYRFTATDESSYILPYETGNLQLRYNTSLKRHPVQIIASCNNIWNQQYQVVDQRPMPGINWQAGFSIKN